MLKKLSKNQKIGLIIAVVVVLLGAGAFAFYKSNDKSSNTAYPESPTAEQVANGSPETKYSTTGGGSESESSNTTTPSTSTSPVKAPQGQASHTIVSKSADAQAENSPNIEVTCITSAGNTCIVRLTSPSGQVSTINNSYDDKAGNFIFNWSAKSYATGNWKMELVATKNGQEASTNIGPLVVQP